MKTLIYLLVIMPTILYSQTWMVGYKEMQIQDSCRHWPFSIHAIENNDDYILTVRDSVYRIDQDGNVDMRFRTVKSFDKKLIRYYDHKYFTASRTEKSDEYIICKYDETGLFLDSFSIIGQQTNIGGLEIVDDRIIVFSINKWISSLDYFDLNGRHILGRWFEQNWTHPGVPGINMQKDSSQFYINVYHQSWRQPDTISVINKFMTIPKIARLQDQFIWGTVFNALYFKDFGVGSNNNVYIPLSQGVAKLKYGRNLTMARSLNGYQLNDTGRIYDGYTNTLGVNRNVVGLLDYPSFLDENGFHMPSRSLLLHCLNESLEVYNSDYIIFKNKGSVNNGRYTFLEPIEGNSMVRNELGGFTILLKQVIYSDTDCYDALPVIIKTDSTCQIPEYRINKKPITTAIYHPDTKSNKFRIYPNPTPGQFNIISPEHISNIRIFDLTGRLIKQSYDTEIDISNQSSGLYIVEIRTKNQIHVEKIIKL